jgi:LacI family kdg operon repressor
VQAFGASVSAGPACVSGTETGGAEGQLASFSPAPVMARKPSSPSTALRTLAVTGRLREAGCNLFADVGLIALDDLDWYPLVGKGITALAQPTETHQRGGLRKPARPLRGDSGAARRIDFKATLIIRGSTQPQ